jgi:hypothetical protein
MPLPGYTICCCTSGCPNRAVCKIASRWSDGLTEELKTYALCCRDCLAAAFRDSVRKQAACRLAEGEVLEAPGIYQLERGRRDAALVRLHDLEQQVRS